MLHSILFHRLFGLVKPEIREVLNVSMVRDTQVQLSHSPRLKCNVSKPVVDDPDIKFLIDQKVDLFWRGIEGGAKQRGEVCCQSLFFVTGPSFEQDYSHIFRKAPEEIMAGPHQRGEVAQPSLLVDSD